MKYKHTAKLPASVLISKETLTNKLVTSGALLKNTLKFHTHCKYIPIPSASAPAFDGMKLKRILSFQFGSNVSISKSIGAALVGILLSGQALAEDICADSDSAWAGIAFESSWGNDNPFIKTDYQATIAALPAAQQHHAAQIIDSLKQAEKILSKKEEEYMHASLQVLELSDKLDLLLAESDIELQKIDALKKLPESEQLQALLLWRDIHSADWLDISALDEKLNELEALLK